MCILKTTYRKRQTLLEVYFRPILQSSRPQLHIFMWKILCKPLLSLMLRNLDGSGCRGLVVSSLFYRAGVLLLLLDAGVAGVCTASG